MSGKTRCDRKLVGQGLRQGFVLVLRFLFQCFPSLYCEARPSLRVLCDIVINVGLSLDNLEKGNTRASASEMVFYFKSTVVDPAAFIYVGKDKVESKSGLEEVDMPRTKLARRGSHQIWVG